MALHQAGVVCEIVEVSLRDKPPALIGLSPKGTVPVLQTREGHVIEESLDIMRWALEQNDSDGWLRSCAHDEHLAMLEANDGAFKQWLDRYKYFERYPEQPQAYYRDEAVRVQIDRLESRLSQYPYLGGATPCLTDAAIFPFVRQFAAVDPGWFTAGPWSATQGWLERWLASAVFVAIMAKR
jgi:glutathione S-transferase